MRTLVAIAVAVTLSQFIEIETTICQPLAAQDRVSDTLKQARKALVGEDKVTAVKTLTAQGAYRRAMGQMSMDGTLTLTLGRPDKMRRSEEMSPAGMINGPVIERVSVLNGNAAWDDTSNRGAGGGGFQMVIRDGPGPPPPPPPGGGPAPAPAQMTPEQMNEARVRRMKVAMQRWMAALFVESPTTPFVDGGIAESPEGKADILESKDDTGRTVRVFVDQATHLPVMVQYQDPKPMMMFNTRGGPGGPGGAPGAGAGAGRGAGGGGGAVVRGDGPMTPEQKEELQKRLEEARSRPPQMGTFAYHLSDFKKVGGVVLPHKIDTSIDGEPNEEWTIEKYTLNPALKASEWEQPKK